MALSFIDEEMLGGEHRRDDSDTGLSVKGEHTNATIAGLVLSNTAHRCVRYSRAQGVFAGVSLEGSSLGPDDDANKDLYGKKVTATEIVGGQAGPPPASAKELLAILTAKSPKNESKGK
jgi:lipid-binding SYLF domain-containing protein